MSQEIAVLFDRLVPESLEPFLQQALDQTLPRQGEGGLYCVCASGRFSGAQTGDLFTFAQRQGLDGALVLVDRDVRRVLYFVRGKVVAAESTLFFERLGRVLERAEVIQRKDMHRLVACEEQRGTQVAASMLPEETARWGLEQRIWEIATALCFTRRAHFLMVEGTPNLGALPLFAIPPDQLAMDGMRAYDEWRNRPARKAPPVGTDTVQIDLSKVPDRRPALPASVRNDADRGAA